MVQGNLISVVAGGVTDLGNESLPFSTIGKFRNEECHRILFAWQLSRLIVSGRSTV